MALTWLTPPGRKRSKGNWALVGARGVLCSSKSLRLAHGVARLPRKVFRPKRLILLHAARTMMAHREDLLKYQTWLAPDSVHIKGRNHLVSCAGSNGEN